MDVSDQKEVAKTAQAILKRLGHVDILVNSAGINSPKRNFHNVSLESWDQIVAINLSGMFYCCHAVLPSMRARKDGLIINVSSWAGRYASTLTGPGYNSTKSAVVALTESVNMEECANGIRATSVLPGGGATDPGEAPGAAVAGGARAHAAGRRSRPHAALHRHHAGARLRE